MAAAAAPIDVLAHRVAAPVAVALPLAGALWNRERNFLEAGRNT